MSKTGRITRRTFLTRAAVGGAALTMGPQLASLADQLAAAAPDGKKPNILLIISDEHTASVTGCYGNTVVKTPNLDALAAKGVVFENCYTTSPLCVPARLSLTAGKYASQIGAWKNTAMLPADYPASLPRVLNATGYESYLCGKMHYDATCRYGFTEIGPNSCNRSFMNGTGGRRAPDDIQDSGPLSDRFTKAFGVGDHSLPLDHDREVTADALEFLSSRKAEQKPFFLLAGYLMPHFPLLVPQDYCDTYKDKVPMPVIPPGDIDRLPLNYKHLRTGFEVTNVPDDKVKYAREVYYGMTQWVDNEIGKVLDALAKTPFADNTVIIYTTDHGENMGDHGMWWKNCMFENSARVPLIVSFPAKWKGGQRRIGACSWVDLAQTVAAMGGAEAPKDWKGTSMTTWLDDPKTKWKDLAVSEYYGHNIASGFAMIRQGKYKYVYHTPADETHPCERELYDLDADPGEFKNLAGDAKYRDTIASMHAAMVKEIGEEPDKTETRCRAEQAKGYGRPRPASAKAGGEE